MHRIRLPRPEQKLALIGAAVIAALVVATVAFSTSWQHQYELSIRYHQDHWVAGIQPLSVEMLVVSTSLAIWLGALIGRKARDMWPAYLALAAGAAQATLMNLASQYHWAWVGVEIAIWPAAAFFTAFEMVIWMLRHRNDAPPTPEPTPGTLYKFDQQTRDEWRERNGHGVTFTEGDSPANGRFVDLQAQAAQDQAETMRRLVEEPMINGNAAAIDISDPDTLNKSKPADPTVHTCNDGAGPKGGRKTPGCPRCDALLAGAVAPKGRRR